MVNSRAEHDADQDYTKLYTIVVFECAYDLHNMYMLRFWIEKFVATCCSIRYPVWQCLPAMEAMRNGIDEADLQD